LRAAPALGYSAWVFYMGTRPADSLSRQVNDKVAHLFGFGLLALLLVPALSRHGLPVRRTALVGAAALATAVGGALEIVQRFLPYRSAELADLVADGAGAVLFCSLLYVVGVGRSAGSIDGGRVASAAPASDRDH